MRSGILKLAAGWTAPYLGSLRIKFVNDLQTLRTRIKSQLQALCTQDQHQAAINFCQNLFESTLLNQAQHIGVYLAHQGELSLKPCIDLLWKQGKTLYLPHLNEQSLIFKKYTPNSLLQANRFGIPEIIDGESIAPEQLDAVLVPLVAFDQAGHRIGMGKGYYDRAFSLAKKPLLIGCAYDFQEIPLFTPQTHDVKMDIIFTP